MLKTFSRYSLATALLMGTALPAFAQGGVPGGSTQQVPAQRPAVTSQAATPAVPATPAAPAVQAQRPATPAQPGGSVSGHSTARPAHATPSQAARPAHPAAPRTN